MARYPNCYSYQFEKIDTFFCREGLETKCDLRFRWNGEILAARLEFKQKFGFDFHEISSSQRDRWVGDYSKFTDKEDNFAK